MDNYLPDIISKVIVCLLDHYNMMKSNFFAISSINHSELGYRTKNPRTYTPDKTPLDKTPKTKTPRTKPPQSKIFVFHFLKIFMASQVHNLLLVQWLLV